MNRTKNVKKEERKMSKGKKVKVVIEGIKTTIPFQSQLMDEPDYVAGNYTTKFMESFVMKDPQE